MSSSAVRDSTRWKPSRAISRPAAQPSTVERNIRRRDADQDQHRSGCRRRPPRSASRTPARWSSGARGRRSWNPRPGSRSPLAEADQPLAQRRVHHVRRAVVLVVPLDAVVRAALARRWRSRSRRRSCPSGWISPTKRRIAAIATTTPWPARSTGPAGCRAVAAGGGPRRARRRRRRSGCGVRWPRLAVARPSAARRSGSALSTHSSPGDRRLPRCPVAPGVPRPVSTVMKETIRG